MHFRAERINDLERLDDEFGHVQDDFPAPPPSRRKRRMERRYKQGPPKRRPHRRPDIRKRCTAHIYEVLAHGLDGVEGREDAVPSDVERAERSRDQILDTAQNIGEVIVAMERRQTARRSSPVESADLVLYDPCHGIRQPLGEL